MHCGKKLSIREFVPPYMLPQILITCMLLLASYGRSAAINGFGKKACSRSTLRWGRTYHIPFSSSPPPPPPPSSSLIPWLLYLLRAYLPSRLTPSRSYIICSSLRCRLLLFQKVILHSLLGDEGDYGGIHVKCISQYMQLTLERVHYKKIDPETLRLRDPRCKVAFYNETVMVIRAPLGNCGTKSAIQGKLILFTNDVYAEVSGSSAISRAPAYQFRLQCLYYTSVKISLHSFKAEPKGPIIINPTPGKCALNNVFSSLINRLWANCRFGS